MQLVTSKCSHCERLLVPIIVKTKDFEVFLKSANFRENVCGAALARHYGYLLQLNPFDRSKTHFNKCCDYALIDPILGKGFTCEHQDCFYLKDLKTGDFSFELFTHGKSGTRDGKLLYLDCDKFVYSAPLLQKLFFFDWKPLRELLIYLYENEMVEVLDFNNSNWKNDSAPVSLILADCQLVMSELSGNFSVFSYEELNIKHIFKHYE